MWRLLKLVGDPNEIDVLLEKSSKQRKTLLSRKRPIFEKTKNLIIIRITLLYCDMYNISDHVSSKNIAGKRRGVAALFSPSNFPSSTPKKSGRIIKINSGYSGGVD